MIAVHLYTVTLNVTFRTGMAGRDVVIHVIATTSQDAGALALDACRARWRGCTARMVSYRAEPNDYVWQVEMP